MGSYFSSSKRAIVPVQLQVFKFKDPWYAGIKAGMTTFILRTGAFTAHKQLVGKTVVITDGIESFNMHVARVWHFDAIDDCADSAISWQSIVPHATSREMVISSLLTIKEDDGTVTFGPERVTTQGGVNAIQLEKPPMTV